ncbi:type II secretion system protein N [Pseudoduganella sp. UC29_71]|uniref:type II secretion system protein N n=1 Tax=Pseudoduganella sp. UC29_71 TaxID=3350174 RepID=UPI003672EEBB
MNRLPVVASFVAVVAMSASCAYWGMLLFKPEQRAIAAVPMQAPPEASVAAARNLFGGDIAVAAASNYQLRGVVAAGNGRGSVAIIAVDGQPGKAYPVGADVASNVKVQEVQALYVVLSEGGVPKRLDLPPPESAGASSATAAPLPMPPVQQQVQPAAPQQPAPPVQQPAPQMPPPVTNTR